MSKKLLFNFNREVIQNYTYVKYVGTIITATNTLEKPIKSAILKGSTKYRDIDTGEVLDAFEDGRNLELVSVKMPVLTTTGKNTLNPNEITFDSSSHVNPESYTYSEGVYTFKNSRSNNQMRFTITKQNASDKILYEVLEVKDLNGNVTPHQISMEGSNDKAYWFSIVRPGWENVGEVKIKLGVDSLEPYKSNILTVNEDVTLRGVGDVKDELDLLTGEVAQRVGKTTITGDLIPNATSWGRNNNSETMCFEEFSGIIPFQWNQIISADWPISNDGYNPSLTHEYFNPYGGYGIFRIKRSRLETEDANGFKKWLNENPITIYHPVIGSESIKTVDLSILDQNENKVSSISSFNDTTHITASSETIPPIFEGYLATKEVE